MGLASHTCHRSRGHLGRGVQPDRVPARHKIRPQYEPRPSYPRVENLGKESLPVGLVELVRSAKEDGQACSPHLQQ